jgi:hypothetical protein
MSHESDAARNQVGGAINSGIHAAGNVLTGKDKLDEVVGTLLLLSSGSGDSDLLESISLANTINDALLLAVDNINVLNMQLVRYRDKL